MTIQTDLTNIFLFLNLVIVIFALSKSLLNYSKIRSLDFLLIGIFFFGFGFFVFFRLFLAPTFIPYLIAGDPRALDFGLILISLNGIWAIGLVCLLIHCYRVLEWRNRPVIVQGLMLIFLVEMLAQAFYYVVAHVHWLYIVDPFSTGFYTSNDWYLQLWGSHFLFSGILGVLSIFVEINTVYASPGMLGLDLGLVIIFLFVFISYLTIKPVKQTKGIKTARAAWVLFGIMNAARWVFYIISSIIQSILIGPGSDYWALVADFSGSTYFFFELMELISMIGVMIVLSLYTESFLITEYQILLVNRLYKFLGAEPGSTGLVRQLVTTEVSLARYLKQLPPEILAQLEKARPPSLSM